MRLLGQHSSLFTSLVVYATCVLISLAEIPCILISREIYLVKMFVHGMKEKDVVFFYGAIPLKLKALMRLRKHAAHMAAAAEG